VAPRSWPCRSFLLAFAALLAAAALAGCGANERNTDVPGFIKQGKTAEQQAVLRSIAAYRTTKDTARACSLVTVHFLSGRFQGQVDNCRQVQREASRHLPDSATVQSVSGSTAKVLVDEPTATRSIYEMRREAGTWKVDDILEAK
jgi:hypothetical protein